MHLDSRIGMVIVAVVLALLATVPAKAANTSRALDRALDEVMDQRGSPPGLSVLLQRGKKVDFRRRGVADIKTDAPMRSRQHYRIASMAKALNGAVALGLASDGKLKLNDTIGEWLPGVLPKAEKVTIAQALQHTAGLPDYIRDDEFVDQLVKNPGQYMKPRELLSFVEDKKLEFKPGSRYGYSDTDNVVVGLIAEKASGKSYEKLLRKYVYKPADMKRTSLPRTTRMPKPYIHGYDPPDGGKFHDTTEFINPALAWASGGIVSTARDMSNFFRAYVGGKLFSRRIGKSQNDFVTGSSSPPGPGRNSATLALFRYRTPCGTVYGHTGSFPGYRLFAAATANGKRSIVFTVNSQIVPPDQGSQEVSDLIRHAQQDAVCHLLR
jgi:D-alanyl-D-alanine carboxypeptidase